MPKKKTKKPFQVSVTENSTAGKNELCITVHKQGTLTLDTEHFLPFMVALVKLAERETKKIVKKRKK